MHVVFRMRKVWKVTGGQDMIMASRKVSTCRVQEDRGTQTPNDDRACRQQHPLNRFKVDSFRHT